MKSRLWEEEIVCNMLQIAYIDISIVIMRIREFEQSPSLKITRGATWNMLEIILL